MRKNRRKNNQNRNILLGFVVLLVMAGGWIGWAAWHSARQPSIERSDTVGTQLGEIAPDFTTPTLQGEAITLSAHRGKPTILFFMAYWCGSCLAEARALTKLQQEYDDQLNIIAIDVDPTSTPEALTQFKQAAGDGDYTWAFDTSQQIATGYRVRSLDTTLIIDAEGFVVYRDEFPTPYDMLKEALAGVGL